MKKNLILSLLLSVTLLACGSNTAEDYDTQMSTYISQIGETASSIDALNPSSPDAADEVLAKLSDLSGAFHNAAALPLPEDYDDCAAPISNAATYMTKAYETYASACAAEPFDAQAAGIAIGYYESSMESLARLGELLKSHETGN